MTIGNLPPSFFRRLDGLWGPYRRIHRDVIVYKNPQGIMGGKRRNLSSLPLLSTCGTVVSFSSVILSLWFIHAVSLVVRQGGVAVRKDFLEFLRKKIQKNDSDGCGVYVVLIRMTAIKVGLLPLAIEFGKLIS